MSSGASTCAFSQILHSITGIKIAELDKKRTSYLASKDEALERLSRSESSRVSAQTRTTRLGKDLAELRLSVVDSKELVNVGKLLLQAEYDPSVPQSEIVRYEEWLKSNMEYHHHRLEYAKLFSSVLSQHLHYPQETVQQEEPSPLDESFELLEEDRLRQLRDKFEDVVFNKLETDENEILEYLESLFPTEELKNIIEGLRNRLKNDTTAIFEARDPFDDDSLSWVIRGLLHNDLKKQQKAVLKSFQSDELVRAELCDVLNMRWAELTSWSWTEDDSGLDVEPRKQLNGKYRVVMQEDVPQSMLTHYVGVSLCVNAKEELKYWLDTVMIPEAVDITTVEADRRHFYLQYRDKYNSSKSLVSRLNQEFWDDFFLSQLPNSVADTGGYDDDTDPKDDSDSKKPWLQVKQQLLHHVASEVLIQRKLYGDVAVVQTDLQWFATSVPHSTIFAVLKFSGLPDKWLSWFRSYLEVPLNMVKTTGDAQEVKKRKRGIPMAHALEKYLGEMILVYMDVAVKREADLLLYRMHDDIVLCGPTAQSEKAWASMQRFAKVMGLEFNRKKTGSVSFNENSSTETSLPDGDVTMDFLKLSTSDGSWTIDTAQVNAHIKQLKKQLDECKDILSFIRTYNSCIGRFFGHTFGLPAQCLGHTHIEEILKTHHRMQQELFGEGGVSAVLKTKLNGLAHDRGTSLSDAFRVTNSFLYNPIILGGLGLANPFIPLLLVEPNLRDKTPAQRVEDFIEHEKSDFRTRKRAFEQESLSSKKMRRTEIFLGNKGYDEDEINVDFNDFLTFEEYTKHRESTSPAFRKLYDNLMSQPAVSNVHLSDRARADLERLAKAGTKGVKPDDLNAEEKYTIQLFSDELFKTFGTVGIIDRSLAPLGVMKAVMGEKTVWQMVL